MIYRRSPIMLDTWVFAHNSLLVKLLHNVGEPCLLNPLPLLPLAQPDKSAAGRAMRHFWAIRIRLRRVVLRPELCETSPCPYPFEKRSPELNVPGGEGFDEREELVRELSSLEEDLLPELEKCIAERKRTLSQAGTLLDNLVSDASAARVEMDKRDGVAASSKKELQDLQRRLVEVGGTGRKGALRPGRFVHWANIGRVTNAFEGEKQDGGVPIGRLSALQRGPCSACSS